MFGGQLTAGVFVEDIPQASLEARPFAAGWRPARLGQSLLNAIQANLGDVIGDSDQSLGRIGNGASYPRDLKRLLNGVVLFGTCELFQRQFARHDLIGLGQMFLLTWATNASDSTYTIDLGYL